MAKQLKQFRWYGKNDPRNVPDVGDGVTQYSTGEVFEEYYPISQLGIQALPGTKFYLNGNVKPIVIGVSGIYDLDIKNGARVTELSFSDQSLEDISNNTTNFLIVDIIYGEED